MAIIEKLQCSGDDLRAVIAYASSENEKMIKLFNIFNNVNGKLL